MTWDTSTPQGDEAISLGDNRIREMKEDLDDALSTEGIFPGIDPTNPVFKWTGKRGNTASRPATPEIGELYFNTQLTQLEYWDGAAWTAYDLVPALGITSAKIAVDAVTSDKIGPGAVDATALDVNAVLETRIADGAVTSGKLANGSVDNNKIDASIAGNGLAGGNGTALSVNVDGSTIEINSDTLRVKDGGITAAKLSAAVLALMSPKSIQRVAESVTINSGLDTYPKTVNVTITSVDTTKAYVIVNGCYHNANIYADASAVTFKAQLTSATNVELKITPISKIAGSEPWVFEFTVVEWN